MLVFKQKKEKKEENLLFNEGSQISATNTNQTEKSISKVETNISEKVNDTTFYPHLRQKVYCYLIHDLTVYNPKEIPPFLSNN